MGGAAPRTRSPAAGRAPPAGGACAVSAAAAPLQSEGVPGSLGPSALPSFPAVRVLPVVLSRRGSAAALPRSPPARRGRSRAVRTSRLRRLRSRRRRPRASLPPGSGECLVSGTPPRPSVRPPASVHSGAPVSVLSVVPRAPLSVLLPLCPQLGRTAAPSFPHRLLCVPAATGPSPLGPPRSAALWSLGCENPTVSAVPELSPLRVGVGPWRLSPLLRG